MGDYASKFQKIAAGVLEPGERLEAAVRGMSAGATAQIAGGAAGAVAAGGAGLLAADKVTGGSREEGRAAEAHAGLPELPPQIALGLTDRRLLVFSRSAMSGKAKDLVGQIPRTAIASITGEESGSKMKPDRLSVALVGGGTVDFEIVRNDGYWRVVEAFES